MQANSESETQESPEDHLSRVEKTVAMNRLLLLVVAGLILTMLASWITLGIIGFVSDDETAALAPEVVQLGEQVVQLEARLQQQQAQIDQQQTQLQAQAALLERLAAPSPAGSDPALRQQLARSLIGQEQGLQQTLLGLKSGMHDLAGMIVGSRSWLEHYQEALNKPLAESRARVEELQRWSTEQTE